MSQGFGAAENETIYHQIILRKLHMWLIFLFESRIKVIFGSSYNFLFNVSILVDVATLQIDYDIKKNLGLSVCVAFLYGQYYNIT